MSAAPLVDQYGHGVLHGEAAPGVFERRLAEAGGATWRAVLRWCPPLLGLDADVPATRYLARRRELGAYTATRLLLRGSGIRVFLLADAAEAGETDDGELTGPAATASAAGGTTRPLAGLTALAARAAGTAGTARAFLDHAAESLVTAARDTAAFVCAADGLGGEGLPEPTAVRHAADRWLADPRGPRRPGPVVTLHLLWGALATGRPVQLHCGDPMPLVPLLHATAGAGTLVLLPSRDHHRAAARLASAFPHVYADAGPEPAAALAEAPPGKLLFSTRAGTLPELHVARAGLFRQALGAALRARPHAEAARTARQIGGGTARQVYRLGEAVQVY
ncbi:amidohydrolase [Streptomyces sp. MS19]|uniref:amidohydrolase n=1 Tax=Streptomyces sp. MS19 TaxID=3385972 RepID=UPI00399FD4F8